MLLELDFSSDTPIYLQIRNQIVKGIASGELGAEEKLPTVRGLAEQSGINMMTVSKAYQLLKNEGYIKTDRRSGAIVAAETTDSLQSKVLGEREKNALEVIIAEAKIQGISREEFLLICGDIYDKEVKK